MPTGSVGRNVEVNDDELGFIASDGLFFVPTYGTVLAAVSFDQTGTTKIGKYLLNHSFMRPGLVTTITAIVIALVLSKLLIT